MKNKKYEFKGLAYHVYKQMGRAIADYKMLSDGDKVLVGVSGGLDSLTLLSLFQMRQRKIPIDFDLLVCFVETNFIKVDTKILITYLENVKIPYVVKRLDIAEKDVNCFWCSWSRRKVLFEAAREHACNKVALGHNLDDTIETTLMNIFFNGEVSTMKPKVDLFEGTLSLIRPLAYVEKDKITQLASKLDFPDTQYACPYGNTSQRKATKEIIAELSRTFPGVKENIFRCLGRIRKEYLINSKPRPRRHESVISTI